MVGVVEGGGNGELLDEVEGSSGAGDEDGRKETDKVPEKRTIETASAIGSTAVRGLGQFKMIFVSTPKVIKSLRSTSIRA